MAKNKSKFIPQSKISTVLLQKKLRELEVETKLHGRNIDAIAKSHDTHITMLSNFARHDIKNSVQSMDGILNANTLQELTEKHIESLKLNLQIIRETIDNFSKLVPYSQRENFSFEQLLAAVEILNRENLYVHKISLEKDIVEGSFNFNLPFQSVLQMINNIIINAIKAFEGLEIDRKIKIQANFNDDFFEMKIYDNASKITFSNINTIFDYGVSSSGGSGIGLYHAKYLCNLYKGNIEIHEITNDIIYNKYFLINLPIIKDRK